jgi:SAM-dependent methyltransferase
MRKAFFRLVHSYVEHTPPHPGRGVLMKLATRVYPAGYEDACASARSRHAPTEQVNGATGAGARPPEPAKSLGYNKLCNLEDFSHPDLLSVLRQVFQHDLSRLGPSFPRGFEYRKQWEVAMTLRTFADTGVLRPDAEVLGVGAGNEPTIFWLTNFVKRVFATDLYLDPGNWAESANASMLVDPSCHWPGPWNRRRLVAQHMNGLELAYEDNTFDAIFSSSSIEHFGTPADVRRAVEEMFRVLRPGGVLSISTEFRIEGPPPGMPGVLMFDERELRALFLTGLAWEPVSPWDLGLSAPTRASEVDYATFSDDMTWHVARYGHILFHKVSFRSYPLVVLRKRDLLWTSVHIALRKPS